MLLISFVNLFVFSIVWLIPQLLANLVKLNACKVKLDENIDAEAGGVSGMKM